MKSQLSPEERYRRRRERNRLRSLGWLIANPRPKKQKQEKTRSEIEKEKIDESYKTVRVLSLIDRGVRDVGDVAEKAKCSRAYVHLIFSSLGLMEEVKQNRKKELEEKKILVLSKRKTLGERFWEKTKKTDSCWLWIGATNPKNGYGGFWNGLRHTSAHRFSYEFFNKKEIPKGLEIDHICRVRNCVNPAHLEAVTHSENTLRGNVPHVAKENIKKAHEAARLKNRSRSFCIRGHEWKEENWEKSPWVKHKHKVCKLCRKMLIPLRQKRKKMVK